MNVFEDDFRDEDEIKRQRAEIRKMIENLYPEPKFKPKVIRKSWREIIKSIKEMNFQKEKVNDNHIKEEFIKMRKRGHSLNYDEFLKE